MTVEVEMVWCPKCHTYVKPVRIPDFKGMLFCPKCESGLAIVKRDEEET